MDGCVLGAAEMILCCKTWILRELAIEILRKLEDDSGLARRVRISISKNLQKNIC